VLAGEFYYDADERGDRCFGVLPPWHVARGMWNEPVSGWHDSGSLACAGCFCTFTPPCN
jgi:hypothetical protein